MLLTPLLQSSSALAVVGIQQIPGMGDALVTVALVVAALPYCEGHGYQSLLETDFLVAGGLQRAGHHHLPFVVQGDLLGYIQAVTGYALFRQQCGAADAAG